MARRHVEHLFSTAYDNALSGADAEQFHAHVRECEACSSAYEGFRASIDALRALPQARMPLAVHLPSTSPVAERRPVWRRLQVPRARFTMGGATAIAAGAAAIIVAVALLHPNGTPSTASLQAPEFGSLQGGSSTTSCAQQVTGVASAAPPSGFDYRTTAIDPRRPGQQLVVATSTGDVARGGQVVVYAQLNAPKVAAAAPGAAAGARPASLGVVPCLSLIGASASLGPYAADSAAAPQTSPLSSSPLGASRANSVSPLFEFTIPLGTAPGTVLHIEATVPPNYPHEGDPPLTADLQITVR